MKTYAAKPRKLRDDSWGVAVETEAAQPGDYAQVTSKSGKCWAVKLAEKVWAGQGVSVWRTNKLSKQEETKVPPLAPKEEEKPAGWGSPPSTDDDIPF